MVDGAKLMLGGFSEAFLTSGPDAPHQVKKSNASTSHKLDSDHCPQVLGVAKQILDMPSEARCTCNMGDT